MKKSDIFTNLVLITLLIMSLVLLNFSVSFIKAEEDGEGADETITEETTEGETEDSSTEGIEGEGMENEEETYIETGDAQSEVEVENVVNTNVVDLGDTEDEEEELEETEEIASESEGFEDLSTESEDLASGSFEETASGSEDAFIEVNNENEADIENEVEGGADTGDNEANDNGGNAIIDTGDASAGANVSNMANTNITGSNFWFNFSNLFQDLIGDVNLNNFQNNNKNDCGLIDCVDLLKVSNKNQGDIINDVEIYAVTGDNSANGNNGDAYIRTGNARVIANIANLLNTNITGSDWFFSILNSFSNWYGNLVLPGKETIENITKGFGSSGNKVDIDNFGQAEVGNNVNVIAETGDNSANNNDGGSCIDTGQAEAKSNILNIINTNIFGDNWLVVGIKVFGNWSGQLFESSLPEGVSWLRTPDGIILFNDDLADDLPVLFQENQDNQGGEDSSLEVSNENDGTVVNNVDIIASTGSNSASNNNGSATIETGNALAVANVANFVNTNIIGKNWLFALVNIFGDWQGDLSFGQPNLWLGESATTSPNPASPGGAITYTLTYINNGDADATGVILTDDFDENHLSVIDTGGGTVIDNPGEIQWDIGTVGIGETQSISYSVAIDSDMPYGTTYLVNQSSIDSYENDANNEDNTDTLSIGVNRPWPEIVYIPHSPPELGVEKNSNGTKVVYAPADIDYTIIVSNPSDYTAYNVMVTDVLSNGEVLNTYAWDLGTVYPGEEIIIDYTIAVGSEVEAGFYTNTAEASGVDGFGNQVISSKDSSIVEVRVLTDEFGEGSEEAESEGSEELVESPEDIEPVTSQESEETAETSEDNQIELPVCETCGGEGEELGVGIGGEKEPEFLAQEISLTEEESSSEPQKELPKRFFLAFVGDFFSNFGLMEILILLLIIAILFLILYNLERRKLRKNI